MLKSKKKIIFTGGNGRFGQVLQKTNFGHNVFFPSKSILDTENINSIEKYLDKKKPDILIHMAALSRPMNVHDLNITKIFKFKYNRNIKYNYCFCYEKN